MDGKHQRGVTSTPTEFLHDGRIENGEAVSQAIANHYDDKSCGYDNPTVEEFRPLFQVLSYLIESSFCGKEQNFPTTHRWWKLASVGKSMSVSLSVFSKADKKSQGQSLHSSV